MKGEHNIRTRTKVRATYPEFRNGELSREGTPGTANFNVDTGYYMCWFPALATPISNYPLPLTINEIEIVK